MLTKENTFTEYPDIVTTKQMMQMLRIGRNKAFQLLNSDIPSIRIGRLHKIPKVFIIEYLNKRSSGN
ncbi:MAG TPA: helix-turn-helix domain-containing protein [Ruminococcus sp.]|nr:helix-turn-helix domain-containing protein [Ruminococcus sp.]